MLSLNPYIKINKLLDYLKNIKAKDNKLPKVILIFNDNFFDKKKFMNLKIPKKSALLLRSYNSKDRNKIAKQLLKFCKMKKIKLLIGSDIKLAEKINADGIHFPEYMLNKNIINKIAIKKIKSRKNKIITSAAHSLKSIKKAECFGIDAALLSPIFPSKSHPKVKNLGLKKLNKILQKIELPIYALGGINLKNVKSLSKTGIIGYAFQRGK
ncbi:MAG: Thiamine-phosphate synthase [Alphaproteobacteria bacterium MarineAlpha6_Bin4]|nr:MAG: Thiamine-phosphate synthase [Alphaproteobacteria bacterium MarineAlpha6_Bin4]|tara:strand:+ start:4909 stop:5541 length:633 start_codon:yes stop_codon:yes gene_type:complete